MTDNNWSPGFHQGVSYDPTDLFRNQTSRRRSSLGADAALGAESDRDPEEVVDDYDELVRWGLLQCSLLVQPPHSCSCHMPSHCGKDHRDTAHVKLLASPVAPQIRFSGAAMLLQWLKTEGEGVCPDHLSHRKESCRCWFLTGARGLSSLAAIQTYRSCLDRRYLLYDIGYDIC